MNPQPNQKRSGQRLVLVQALRAIAASMVVLLHAESLTQIYAEQHHYSFTPIDFFPLGAGVDLFFVISGFVIVYSSQSLFASAGGTRKFMTRRLIRILPLYWTATTLRLAGLAAAVLIGAGIHFPFPDLAGIVTSYLFIPYDTLGYGSDYPFPVVDLGWSLNYEMFFYVLFACFIGFSCRKAVVLFVTCIAVVVGLGAVFAPTNTVLQFWSHPIIIEFAVGTVLALLFLNGTAIPAWMRLLLVALGLGLWLTIRASWFVDLSAPGLFGWTRVLIWGVGASLLVGACVLGTTTAEAPWLRRVVVLGDASYVLYLLHPLFFLVVKAFLKAVPVPQSCLWLVVIGAACFAIGSAVIVYQLAEAPALKFLKERLGKKVATAA